LLNVASGIRPKPNAVSRALKSGLVGIVFATSVTVITNDVGEKLLTVNLAVAKRVALSLTPCQVTVNDVFPFTKTVVCAEPGTAEARTSENTAIAIRRTFMNIPMVGALLSTRCQRDLMAATFTVAMQIGRRFVVEISRSYPASGS
jgi:hypothetical protein